MNADCYSVTAVPHRSRLFEDYAAALGGQAPASSGGGALDAFYSPLHLKNRWAENPPALEATHRRKIAELLRNQNVSMSAAPAALANIDRLEQGAAAVVTGQQAGLFGGPLLSLLKAASAIRLAAEASQNGHPHVPIFWIASEDHDFDEVNESTFPSAEPPALETLGLASNEAPRRPVGNIPFGAGIASLIGQLRQYLGDGPVFDLLASLYTPDATFVSAFGSFMAQIFGDSGLIVIDAASRPFHALAAGALRQAILQPEQLRSALLQRTEALESAGYHAQVAVGDSSSLLFLVDDETGIRTALRTLGNGAWSAGDRKYSTDELLAILNEAPERLSPNVLLRPVMQDALLPTSVYVGGPAEVAYFAQSQVVYQALLGRITPILPRFSATLIEPRLAKILERHGLSLDDVFSAGGELAERLAARVMPVEGKRKLAAAGKALDDELQLLTEWMHTQSPGLGHYADVAASKMKYQMARLRRIAADYTLERETSLQRHADALSQMLYPGETLQERVLAGAWFLARFGPSLKDRLIEHARCDGSHCALFL